MLFELNLALLCVCAVGIILNVLSAVVLAMEINSIPGSRILLGLAAADGGLLLVIGCRTGIFRLCADIYYWYSSSDDCPAAILDIFRDPVFFATGQCLFTSGIYLVIALAMGRYVAVNKPLMALKWNGKQRQRTVVLVVFALSFLLGLPRFFEGRFITPYNWRTNFFNMSYWVEPYNLTAYGYVNHLDYNYANIESNQSGDSTGETSDLRLPCGNERRPCLGKSPISISYFASRNDTPGRDPGYSIPRTPVEVMNDSTGMMPPLHPPNYTGSSGMESPEQTIGLYQLLYVNIFNIILQYLIPIPCLFIINIHFLRGLSRFHRRRKRLTQNHRDSNSWNETCVILNITVILTIFLLCQTSALSLEIYRYCAIYMDPSFNNSVANSLLYTFSMLFMALNSATNFWIYLAFLKDFQQALGRLISCAGCRGLTRQESMDTGLGGKIETMSSPL